MDEFPVLKAFQQYIDAEQEKARRRLLTLGIVFGVITTMIIAIFVVMLVFVNQRNQSLNDRLIEYAMKRESASTSPVVVQPNQDAGAIVTLTTKLSELQRQLDENKKSAELAAKKSEQAAEKTAEEHRLALEDQKKKTAEDAKEIKSLKALLAQEREKLAAEREKQRQSELEAYRRRQYAEIYAKIEKEKQEKELAKKRAARRQKILEDIENDVDTDDEILNDDGAINYFEENKKEPEPKDESYSIPVDVKVRKSTWSIPND